MVYVTGDTHGDFQRFRKEIFPEQKKMSKEDYVIICGDFGGVWDGRRKERWWLNWLEQLPFTILFVSGNHENFDRLARYPVEEWNGGRIQRILPHVIHLLRGQVFRLEGHSFFTMGGGKSHDIQYGILNPWDEDFEERYLMYCGMGVPFRVNHQSWWKEEMPSEEEYQQARAVLEKENWMVDYIITHSAPSSLVDRIGGGAYNHDQLTDFLETVKNKVRFQRWLFGHYHDNQVYEDRWTLLYDRIIRLL